MWLNISKKILINNSYQQLPCVEWRNLVMFVGDMFVYYYNNYHKTILVVLNIVCQLLKKK